MSAWTATMWHFYTGDLVWDKVFVTRNSSGEDSFYEVPAAAQGHTWKRLAAPDAKSMPKTYVLD